MTRLMSFWAMPTLAANTAVVPPMTPTTASAAGAYSNIGDSRQTIKTPAVTIVAAWISAERSEEHTLNSSHVKISYAVFCLKKKNDLTTTQWIIRICLQS